MQSKRIFVLLLTILIGIIAVSQLTPSPVTVKSIQDSIVREVAPDAHFSEVTEFLDSKNIIHSNLQNHPELDSDFQNKKLDEKRHLIKSKIGAIIRNVESNFLISR